MKKSVKKVNKKKSPKFLSENIKNLDFLDIALTKLAVFAFTLWLVGMTSLLPPQKMVNVFMFLLSYKWFIFIVAILATIRPMVKFLQKKK